MPRSLLMSCQPVSSRSHLGQISGRGKVWPVVGQPPAPYTYNNYAKIQIGFIFIEVVWRRPVHACVRWSWMIVLVESGDVHACVRWNWTLLGK